MRRIVLVLLVPIALIGCVSVSINVDQTAAPPTSSPAPAFTSCAPGALGTRIEVQQNAMQPTLEPGDLILTAPAVPQPGDIVAFHPPAAWTTDPAPFIKRAVGIGGDVIEVRPDGRVYRNGTAVDEPYTFANAAGVHEPTEASPDQSRWVVPDGQLFVLGDHRQKSADSRVFGPISVNAVIGVAAWRCTPNEGPLE